MWTLTYAYRLKDFQITGAPDWVNQFASAYDIEAKPATPVTEAECRLMVRSLLADRFKLKTHNESRDAPVYLLTVGKNGPKKLREGGAAKLNGIAQIGADWADGMTMAMLAGILSNYADRPVLDRTGLQAKYGVTLDLALSDGDNRASIFTAVQEQLGLKLEPGRAAVDVLVIDRIERPDEN